LLALISRFEDWYGAGAASVRVTDCISFNLRYVMKGRVPVTVLAALEFDSFTITVDEANSLLTEMSSLKEDEWVTVVTPPATWTLKSNGTDILIALAYPGGHKSDLTDPAAAEEAARSYRDLLERLRRVSQE
jgi:hypothetical protein